MVPCRFLLLLFLLLLLAVTFPFELPFPFVVLLDDEIHTIMVVIYNVRMDVVSWRELSLSSLTSCDDSYYYLETRWKRRIPQLRW